MTLQNKYYDIDFLINLETEADLYHLLSDQFNDLAEGYYYQANQELLKHLNLNSQARVLDLACGTGHLAMQMARQIGAQGKVVGVDFSTSMLEEARLDAEKEGLKNVEFIQKDILDALPQFPSGEFDIGVSCFALSFLGCNFILKNLARILGPNGQIGITSTAMYTLEELQPLVLEFPLKFPHYASSYDLEHLPDIPIDAENFEHRIEEAGFKNPKVKNVKVPLVFENGEHAANFLISTGLLSNFFYSLKDKSHRREVLEWAIKRVDEIFEGQAQIKTHVDFLVGWNEPQN